MNEYETQNLSAEEVRELEIRQMKSNVICLRGVADLYEHMIEHKSFDYEEWCSKELKPRLDELRELVPVPIGMDPDGLQTALAMIGASASAALDLIPDNLLADYLVETISPDALTVASVKMISQMYGHDHQGCSGDCDCDGDCSDGCDCKDEEN